MTAARYAIYLAPSSDTPLWQFGSAVLGYDAISGADVHGFAPAGMEAAVWRGLTQRPRTYGFHATLKAPFRLAPETTEQDLEEALALFCTSRPSFDLGPLAVRAMSEDGQRGFAALTPVRPSAELAALERDVVEAFDRFRAPLTQGEIAKRKPEALTVRQRQSLERYGYPHTGPDYQFHMTLSSAIDDVAEIADRLADAMANAIGTAHLKVDALVLFRQASPDENFRIMRRFGLL